VLTKITKNFVGFARTCNHCTNTSTHTNYLNRFLKNKISQTALTERAL